MTRKWFTTFVEGSLSEETPTIDVGKKHILALYGTAKDGSPVDRLLRQTRGEDLSSNEKTLSAAAEEGANDMQNRANRDSSGKAE